ncbi:hypothetical protein D3C84_951570 [compost metagenome]
MLLPSATMEPAMSPRISMGLSAGFSPLGWVGLSCRVVTAFAAGISASFCLVFSCAWARRNWSLRRRIRPESARSRRQPRVTFKSGALPVTRRISLAIWNSVHSSAMGTNSNSLRAMLVWP